MSKVFPLLRAPYDDCREHLAALLGQDSLSDYRIHVRNALAKLAGVSTSTSQRWLTYRISPHSVKKLQYMMFLETVGYQIIPAVEIDDSEWQTLKNLRDAIALGCIGLEEVNGQVGYTKSSNLISVLSGRERSSLEKLDSITMLGNTYQERVARLRANFLTSILITQDQSEEATHLVIYALEILGAILPLFNSPVMSDELRSILRDASSEGAKPSDILTRLSPLTSEVVRHNFDLRITLNQSSND